MKQYAFSVFDYKHDKALATSKGFKSLMTSFSLIAFACLTFVNDFNIGLGIPAFYLIWICIIALRVILRVPYKRIEFYSQVLLIAIAMPFFFREALNGAYYANSLIFSVLYINAIFLWGYIADDNKTIYITSLVAMIAFSCFSMISLLSESIRAYIVFGPNVLYRVHAFFFAILMISGFLLNDERKSIFGIRFLLILIMFLVCMAATGSRGALIVFFTTFFYLILNARYFFKSTKNKFLSIAMFSLVFMVFSYLCVEYLGKYIWRLYHFDIISLSQGARTTYYSSVSEYLNNPTFFEVFFGFGSTVYVDKFGFHPHSIILEALMYHGLFLFTCIVACYLIYAHVFMRNINLCAVAFPFIGFWVGALLSGNLLYNYPVLSCGAIIFTVYFNSLAKNKLN